MITAIVSKVVRYVIKNEILGNPAIKAAILHALTSEAEKLKTKNSAVDTALATALEAGAAGLAAGWDPAVAAVSAVL